MAKVTQTAKVMKLADLVTFPGNPNRHPQNQIDALATSIERYGQYYPIIIDEKNQILAGHGKKLALEKLGKTEGNVMIIKGLTDKQKMKLVIEDNKIQSLSHVDIDAVEEMLREIGETDVLGFNFEYLDGIINESLTDNMGVDLQQIAQPSSKPKQNAHVENIAQEKQNADDEEQEDMDAGMQKAHTIICPHCGKEITI